MRSLGSNKVIVLCRAVRFFEIHKADTLQQMEPTWPDLGTNFHICARSTDAIGDWIWSSDRPTKFPGLCGRMTRVTMFAASPWDGVGFSYFLSEREVSPFKIFELLVGRAGV